MRTSCIDCEDRTAECHASCKIYAEFQKNNNFIRKTNPKKYERMRTVGYFNMNRKATV